MINRRAIYALPEEMFRFYKMNLAYLEAHAVDPDKRRYAVEGEAVKHYIDLDSYLDHCPVYDSLQCYLPVYWNFTSDSLANSGFAEHGILPWNLSFQVYRLTKAFKEGSAERILRLSAEIGHYAGDACVPLHTTSNYNGQLTGQVGIHALWESGIPEHFSDQYIIYLKKADYLSDIQHSVWDVVLESHALLDSVLDTEKYLRESCRPDLMYTSTGNDRSSNITYSDHYISEWEKDVGQMVERRMKRSAHFIASLWYTAWINAGQPDLSDKGLPGCLMLSDGKASDGEDFEHH